MKVTVARIASASRLISVCEKTVPATIGSWRREEPGRRRVSTSILAGSPMRPGNTAEPITPIIVARITGAHATSVSGSAARSTSCQEPARSSSESPISASASTIQPGCAEVSALPMRCSPRRESANARIAARMSSRMGTTTRLRRRGRGVRCGDETVSPITVGVSECVIAVPARVRPRVRCRVRGAWRLRSRACEGAASRG